MLFLFALLIALKMGTVMLFGVLFFNFGQRVSAVLLDYKLLVGVADWIVLLLDFSFFVVELLRLHLSQLVYVIHLL